MNPATATHERALDPPSGVVTVVFTDVVDSTRLWERHPRLMLEALRVHHACIRGAIQACGGYEVKTEGDAFMVAFSSARSAVEFCASTQRALLEVAWPQALLEDPAAAELRDTSGQVLMRGLRVRMGVHQGEPLCERDPVTGRMDYLGRTVNIASRVSSTAGAGQILVTYQVWSDIEQAEASPQWKTRLFRGCRLKGFDAPIDLVDIAPADLHHRRKGLTDGLQSPTNLHPDPLPFIGRDRELQRVHGLLSDGGRLVTLLGPGGIGKTRLASHVGLLLAREQDYEGGVWFCDLSEARSHAAIINAVGTVLGAAMMEADEASDVDPVARAIVARGPVVIVLDNFEQVTTFAKTTVARWLEAAPEARFIVTTRVALRIQGERILDILSLRFPREDAADDEAVTSEAVQLFVQKASMVRPGYKLRPENVAPVAAIVRTLEGVALAIELAAARMKSLTESQIRQRLEEQLDFLRSPSREVSLRRASLRGAIQWSWNLLSTTEQLALRACAVFRGGFSVDAAEAVLPADEGGVDRVIEMLANLKEKSMLRLAPAEEGSDDLRYAMYESIREFVADQTDHPEAWANASGRHAAFYASFGASLVERLHGPEEQSALKQIRLEFDNLVALIDRYNPPKLASPAEADLVLQAARALDGWLAPNGPLNRHLEILEAALSVSSNGNPSLQAAVFLAQGLAKSGEASLQPLRVALELAQSAGDRAVSSRVHVLLATRFRELGDYPRCEAHLEKAREEAVPDDRWFRAYRVGNLGNLLADRGDLEAAIENMQEAVNLFRAVGDIRYEALFSGNLGSVHFAVGNTAVAHETMKRVLLSMEELGETRVQAVCYVLGLIEWELGHLEEATQQFERALSLRERLGLISAYGVVLYSWVGAAYARLGRLRLAQASFDKAAGIQADGNTMAEMVRSVTRGHLDLAFSRRDAAAGALEAAQNHRRAAEKRLADLPPGAAESSLDMRLAVRGLKHALEASNEPRC